MSLITGLKSNTGVINKVTKMMVNNKGNKRFTLGNQKRYIENFPFSMSSVNIFAIK